VLAAIRARGIEPEIVLYAQNPPSEKEIKSVLRKTGLSARELLRQKGEPYNSLHLGDLGDSELVAAMHAHPLLIERPVVVTPKGARLCRPADRLDEIL
jgi:arsenate reductase